VIVVMAIGTLLGLAAGFAKKPSYTAESRLVVGKTVQLDNLAAIPGLDVAGQSLAASYSRLVSTETVAKKAATILGRSSLGGTLSASPIPLSPVVLVEASAATTAGARALADAGAKALVQTVNDLNAAQLASADDLLKRYEQTDQTLLLSVQNLATLRQQLVAAQATGNATDIANLQNQVLTAQTAVDGNQIKLNALAADYASVFSPSQFNSQVVQRVGSASATGNNRKSFLALTLFVAVVMSFAIALALATWIDFRHRVAR